MKTFSIKIRNARKSPVFSEGFSLLIDLFTATLLGLCSYAVLQYTMIGGDMC